MAGKVSATQTSFRVLLLNNSFVPALPVSEVVFPDRKAEKQTQDWRERGKRGREKRTGTYELEAGLRSPCTGPWSSRSWLGCVRKGFSWFS